MVATPIPISTHLVQTVLQYILPPNLPIPPHLLSTSSLERHHYLSISPEDTTAYLCWPSSESDAEDIVRLMGQASSQDTLMFNWKPDHEVRYTVSDEDTVLAHVRPNSESPLRVVFMWDSDESRWGYHDCRLMPFPSSAHSQLEPAIANSARSLSRSSSPDSDYWGGCASSDTSPDIAVPPVVSAEDEEKAEAAYWASYGTVHGSGDSTVPSPRPSKPLVIPPADSDANNTRAELDPFLANLHLRLHSQDHFLSPYYTGSDRSHSPEPASSRPAFEHDLNYNAHNKYGFPDVPEIKPQNQSYDDQFSTPATEVSAEDGESGLRETIRELYRTWKGKSETKNEGDFIKVVQDALYS